MGRDIMMGEIRFDESFIQSKYQYSRGRMNLIIG